MKNYSFGLDKTIGSHRAKKFVCPSCGKRRFVRFIDYNTLEYYPSQFGRCDREESCGYFLSPNANEREVKKREIYKQEAGPDFIPESIFKKYWEGAARFYFKNNFVKWLVGIAGENKILAWEAISEYWVSNDTYGNGAVVFWYIDYDNKIRSGKIIGYNDDGHKNGFFSWVHTRKEHFNTFNLNTCLFGEHLLAHHPDKVVGMVESEKTAILSSMLIPDLVWVATGSLNGIGKTHLNEKKVKSLIGRDVVLFPDLSKDAKAYKIWDNIAKQMNLIGINAKVDDILESSATDEQREQGMDLADFLILNSCF